MCDLLASSEMPEQVLRVRLKEEALLFLFSEVNMFKYISYNRNKILCFFSFFRSEWFVK